MRSSPLTMSVPDPPDGNSGLVSEVDVCAVVAGSVTTGAVVSRVDVEDGDIAGVEDAGVEVDDVSEVEGTVDELGDVVADDLAPGPLPEHDARATVIANVMSDRMPTGRGRNFRVDISRRPTYGTSGTPRSDPSLRWSSWSCRNGPRAT